MTSKTLRLPKQFTEMRRRGESNKFGESHPIVLRL